MTDTPQVLLAHHLKTLKLPTFLREYDKIALSRTRFPWTQNWLNRSVQGGPEHDRQF